MNLLLFLPTGGWEIFAIIFVVLLLFGGRKIPELMRGLGRGIREFNSARATVEDEIRKGMDDQERKELEELRRENAERENKKQKSNPNSSK
jgi:sec-independent protein translocase protein TatA